MTWLESVIQGVIQGLAEFLPISSSGHLSVYQHFAGITGSAMQVTVFLHLGTLFSLAAVFYRQFWGLICEFGCCVRDVFTGKFSFKKATGRRRMLFMLIISSAMLLFILPVKDGIEGLVGDGSITAEGICFLFSGALILVSSRFAAPCGTGKKEEGMKALDAVIIGAAQAAATLPGISRSGSTISASLLTGCERGYAFDYSFILGTPAVLLATLLELREAAQTGIRESAGVIILGMAVAAVVGYFAIRLAGSVVRSGKFKYFGWYCLAAGAAVLACSIYESVSGNSLAGILAR